MLPLPSSPPVAAVTSNDPAERFVQELDYVARSLSRLGISRHDIDDLVQEVFEVFYRRRFDYDLSRPLRPWLFGIAFRVASSHHKRRLRELPVGVLDVPTHDHNAEESALQRQREGLVEVAIQSLSLKLRPVFVMHELEDVDVRDVARALGIPLFTVYSRLRKARKDFAAAVRQAQAQEVK